VPECTVVATEVERGDPDGHVLSTIAEYVVGGSQVERVAVCMECGAVIHFYRYSRCKCLTLSGLRLVAEAAMETTIKFPV
jgi:hypothetical protein